MKLSITEFRSQEEANRNEYDTINIYRRNEIAHKFADQIVEMILKEPSCLIHTSADDITFQNRYEIHVLSPEELRILIWNVESKVRQGLPVVF